METSNTGFPSSSDYKMLGGFVRGNYEMMFVDCVYP